MVSFRHEGRRLAYTIHGEGERTTVLIHGLLLSQKMRLPLARTLAARGNRVVTLDLLGHGKSDRPRDMTETPWPSRAAEVRAPEAPGEDAGDRPRPRPRASVQRLRRARRRRARARLRRAESILELRTRPLRLTGELADFTDECWRTRRGRSASPGRRVA